MLFAEVNYLPSEDTAKSFSEKKVSYEGYSFFENY